MNLERYERLVRILKSGNYKVDITNLGIISYISRHLKNKKYIYLKPVINRKGVMYRLVENKKRYEYRMHEIISVFLNKYIIDMVCNFIDGNNHNIHPSNLYWTDKKGGSRINVSGSKSSNSKLTKEDVIKIKEAKFSKNRHNGSSIKKMAEELGISKHTIINIRRGNGGWNNINLKTGKFKTKKSGIII